MRSGKIYAGDFTSTLKDYCAGVQVLDKQHTVIVTLGHGGLLGGMDSKITYTKIDKAKYDELKPFVDDYIKWDKMLDKLNYGNEVHEEVKKILPADKLKELMEYKKTQDETDKINKELRKHAKTDNFVKTDACQVIGVLKDHVDVSIYPKQMKTLKEVEGYTQTLDIGMVKKVFREIGYKVRDIYRIYCSDLPVVHTIVMKNGEHLIVAPKVYDNDAYVYTEIKGIVRKEVYDRKTELMRRF